MFYILGSCVMFHIYLFPHCVCLCCRQTYSLPSPIVPAATRLSFLLCLHHWSSCHLCLHRLEARTRAVPQGPPRCDEDDEWEWEYDQQYSGTTGSTHGSTFMSQQQQELDVNDVLYDLLAVRKQYSGTEVQRYKGGPVAEGVTAACTACGHSAVVPATAERAVLSQLLAGMGYAYDPVTDAVTPVQQLLPSQPGPVTAAPGLCVCCGSDLVAVGGCHSSRGPVAESVEKLGSVRMSGPGSVRPTPSAKTASGVLPRIGSNRVAPEPVSAVPPVPDRSTPARASAAGGTSLSGNASTRTARTSSTKLEACALVPPVASGSEIGATGQGAPVVVQAKSGSSKQQQPLEQSASMLVENTMEGLKEKGLAKISALLDKAVTVTGAAFRCSFVGGMLCSVVFEVLIVWNMETPSKLSSHKREKSACSVHAINFSCTSIC